MITLIDFSYVFLNLKYALKAIKTCFILTYLQALISFKVIS